MFPFPFALTAIINISTGSLAFLIDLAQRQSRSCLAQEAAERPTSLRWAEVWKLVGVGGMQGVEIGFFNKALEYMSVSHRTMVVSTNMLFVMSVAVACGLEDIGWRKMLAVGLLTTGGAFQALSTWSHRTDSDSEIGVHGTALAIAAMLLGALRWAFMQHLTQRAAADSGLRTMSKLEMVWRITPSLAMTCITFALCFEFSALTKLTPALFVNAVAVGAFVLVLMASELKLVQLTSAVALNVAAALHNIPVAVAGVVLFEETVHKKAAIGFCFSLVGAVVYTLARGPSHESLEGEANPLKFQALPKESELVTRAMGLEIAAPEEPGAASTYAAVQAEAKAPPRTCPVSYGRLTELASP